MGFALGLAAADAPRAKTDESPSIKRKMDDVAEAVAAVKRDLSGEKSPSIDWLITGMPRRCSGSLPAWSPASNCGSRSVGPCATSP